MENGIFREREVEQLLSQYELFEIYTDDAVSEIEASYREQQISITGYYANPTYIILVSTDHLEVGRESFTNSSKDFIAFLEAGISDTPAFESRIQIEGLKISERGEEVRVLMPEGAWNYSGGVASNYMSQPVESIDTRF